METGYTTWYFYLYSADCQALNKIEPEADSENIATNGYKKGGVYYTSDAFDPTPPIYVQETVASGDSIYT